MRYPLNIRAGAVAALWKVPHGLGPGFSSKAMLKGDQPVAFDAVMKCILGGQRITKLTGYAGTGKTYLLAEIARTLMSRGYHVTLAAPTHKAKAVIAEKLGDLGADVATIHSLLGLRLVEDIHEDTGGHILRAASEPDLSGVVICDEASMIGRELVERIGQIPDVQWLFVGDPAQLPPVGEKPSELLSNPDATLEQVIRQGEGSEIIDLATRIRSGDLAFSNGYSHEVRHVADASALFDAALQAFRRDEYQADAAYARMLVFRNERRRAINKAMRELLVGADEPYVPGEWLVMYKQYDVMQGQLERLAEEAKASTDRRHRARLWKQFWDLKNSGTFEVLHVSQEIRITGARRVEHVVTGQDWITWRLEVESYGKAYTLFVLDESEKERWLETRADLRKAALVTREERDGHDRKSVEWENLDKEKASLWGRFFSLENSFAWVDYAYAMTTHKSQGSTFTHAFVDIPDLLSSGGMRQSLAYVAATRPSDSLTIYTTR